MRDNLPALRCAYRRVWENTPEFKEDYRWRSGIEGTNSQFKSQLGTARLRVRGMESVRLVVTLQALGLDIFRCDRALIARLNSFFDIFTRFRWVKTPSDLLMTDQIHEFKIISRKFTALSLNIQCTA